MSFFRPYVATVAIGFIALVLLNTLVDPLRFFTDQSIAGFDKQERFRSAGLLRNYNYDAILVGSSMAKNYVIADINRLFKSNSLLLPVSGGSLYEQATMVRLALSTGKPKLVIWEIYDEILIADADETRQGASFPLYMYDDKVLNDIFYVFNFNTTLASVDAIANWLKGERHRHDEWQTIEYTAHKYRYGCPAVMQLQLVNGGLPTGRDDRARATADSIRNIDSNLLAVVRANPEVEFKLFSPPVSFAYQALQQQRQPNKIMAMVAARKYAYAELAKQANVTLYDFASVSSITKDFNNYRDLMHFSGELSHQLLVRIANDKNRLAGNWRQELSRQQRALSRYAVEQELEKCLHVALEQSVGIP